MNEPKIGDWVEWEMIVYAGHDYRTMVRRGVLRGVTSEGTLIAEIEVEDGRKVFWPLVKLTKEGKWGLEI